MTWRALHRILVRSTRVPITTFFISHNLVYSSCFLLSFRRVFWTQLSKDYIFLSSNRPTCVAVTKWAYLFMSSPRPIYVHVTKYVSSCYPYQNAYLCSLYRIGLRVFPLPNRPICVPVTKHVSFYLHYQIHIPFRLFLKFSRHWKIILCSAELWHRAEW
jgi:hypothetical protein